MNTPDIFTLWEKSNRIIEEETPVTKRDIERFIKPRIRKNMIPLMINMFVYLAMQFAGILLLAYDISLFRENRVLLCIVISLLVVLTTSFFFGIDLLYRIRRTNYENRDILANINSKLKLFRINFEVWLWFCSASVVILPLAINFMTDSINGEYRVNNTELFISILSIMFFGIYLLNKLSLFKVARELKDYYSDLEEGSIENTRKKIEWMKRYRIPITIGFIILVFILILFAVKGFISHAH